MVHRLDRSPQSDGSSDEIAALSMYKKELIHTPARGAKMDRIKTTTWSHPPKTTSSAPAPWGAMSARNEAGRALLLSASTVLVVVFLTGC